MAESTGGTAREAAVAAAACALGAWLFVAPWRPNAATIPTTVPPAFEDHVVADAVAFAYAYRAGARNLVSILSGGGGGWFDAPYLLPLSTPLATMDHRLLEQVWAAPLFVALDAVTAWGWLVLAGLWATALASYALGRALTGSAWGGAAAAVLYGLGPLRAASLPHPQLVAVPWIPLWLLALVLFVEAPTARRGAALAAASALLAVDLTYHALHMALLLPLVLGLAVARGRAPWRRAAAVLAGASALALPAVAPAARAYAAYHRTTGLERSEDLVAHQSADLIAWATAADGSLLLPGGAPAPLGRSTLAFLFPGLAACALATAGGRALGRRSPEACAVAAAAFALTFGTGRRLLWALDLPPLPIGPYALLRLLPAGRAFGTPTVAAPFVHAVVATAAAIGAAAIARRSAAGRAVAVAALALGFLEARLGVRAAAVGDVADRAALEWIRDRGAPGAVAVLPIGRHVDPAGWRREAVALRGAAIHGRPTPNGATATILPWKESIAAHLDRPRPGVAVPLLGALGVRYVVAEGADATAALEALGLSPVLRTARAVVLEVPDPAPFPVSIASVQEAMREVDHRTLTDLDGRAGGGRLRAPALVRAAAGAPLAFPLEVENAGEVGWCAHGAILGGAPAVSVGARRWRPMAPTADPDPRAPTGAPLSGSGALPHDLLPGETAAVRFESIAPVRPGRYRVEIDLHLDGAGWFSPADSPAVTVEVEVR